jgi:hypothetical protein
MVCGDLLDDIFNANHLDGESITKATNRHEPTLICALVRDDSFGLA